METVITKVPGPISPEMVTKMADKIEALQEFKDTVTDGKDPEFMHTYNAIWLLDRVIIQSAFWDSHTTDTSYFIWYPTDNTLRPCNDAEDEMIRGWEELNPWLELDDIYGMDVMFIINRNPDNSVERGDNKAPGMQIINDDVVFYEEQRAIEVLYNKKKVRILMLSREGDSEGPGTKPKKQKESSTLFTAHKLLVLEGEPITEKEEEELTQFVIALRAEQ